MPDDSLIGGEEDESQSSSNSWKGLWRDIKFILPAAVFIVVLVSPVAIICFPEFNHSGDLFAFYQTPFIWEPLFIVLLSGIGVSARLFKFTKNKNTFRRLILAVMAATATSLLWLNLFLPTLDDLPGLPLTPLEEEQEILQRIKFHEEQLRINHKLADGTFYKFRQKLFHMVGGTMSKYEDAASVHDYVVNTALPKLAVARLVRKHPRLGRANPVFVYYFPTDQKAILTYPDGRTFQVNIREKDLKKGIAEIKAYAAPENRLDIQTWFRLSDGRAVGLRDVNFIRHNPWNDSWNDPWTGRSLPKFPPLTYDILNAWRPWDAVDENTARTLQAQNLPPFIIYYDTITNSLKVLTNIFQMQMRRLNMHFPATPKTNSYVPVFPPAPSKLPLHQQSY